MLIMLNMARISIVIDNADEHGPDSMWEADHCDCEVCEPDNPFQACVPDDPNPTPDDMHQAAWGRRNLDLTLALTLASPLIMIM